jgi:succinoglycan biosynthesis transport protein ExoP
MMDGSSNTDDGLEIGWRNPPPTLRGFFGLVKRQVLVVLACIAASVALATVIIVYTQPQYTSRVTLSLDAPTGTETQSEEATSINLATHSELISSDETTADVITRLDLLDQPEFVVRPSRLIAFVDSLRAQAGLAPAAITSEDPVPATIRKVREGLSVSRTGATRLIEVRYTSTSPELSAGVANTFAAAYIDSIMARSERTNAQRITRLEGLAEETRQKVAVADSHIRSILRQPGRGVADPQELEKQIFGLRQQLSVLEANAAALSTKLSLITASEEGTDSAAMVIDTPESRRILTELVAAEDRLALIRQRTDVAPQAVPALEEGINNLHASLRQELRLAANGIEIELQTTTAQRDNITDQINRLTEYIASDSWSELEAAQRDRSFYDTLFQDYLNRLENVRREAPNRADLRIVSDALLPTAPSSPRILAVLAISFTLGAFLGLGLAAMREWNRHDRAAH